MFRKIMIANRGEIAMRIVRCCHEMGIDTVVVYSEADQDSLAVQMSTEAVCIGPAPAAESYLNMDVILEAAKRMGCDAIHPGYGFLSENAEFADRCRKEDVVWIGPDADMIRHMGDKQAAKSLMRNNGVPVVPGSDGLVETADDAAKIAAEVGYPVLLKATAGGGGRGMRIAVDESELEGAFRAASAEAQAAFGNGSLYLEKLIINPRHIEVQILADTKGNVIHLGERDCSMQRRNQKLIEESPAKCLNNAQREALFEAAVKAAKAAGYVSAGTVEFVLDQNGKFYFIEMNTRIQVEHTVTEMVSGMDLIREQIRIAAGLSLSKRQEEVQLSGHAIECRINAERPELNFAPSPGTIRFLHLPDGFGVRCDNALYQGYEITPFYDSMIAKVIVHAPTRLQAIRKMRVALEEMMIEGVETNIGFLYLMMFNPDYMMSEVDTSFLETHTEEILRFEKESKG